MCAYTRNTQRSYVLRDASSATSLFAADGKICSLACAPVWELVVLIIGADCEYPRSCRLNQGMLRMRAQLSDAALCCLVAGRKLPVPMHRATEGRGLRRMGEGLMRTQLGPTSAVAACSLRDMPCARMRARMATMRAWMSCALRKEAQNIQMRARILRVRTW